jgi:4a-hydroxytetrahydrobiopterin dehydratase
MNLGEMKCTACRADSPRATEAEITTFTAQLPEWRIIEVEGVQRLERTFRFKNFVQALSFANRVGEVAEAEGHHPKLVVEWGSVSVQWWTHAIHGLHVNDFILAAQTDKLI